MYIRLFINVNKSSTVLNMTTNDICPDGNKAFGEALQVNTVLRVLDVRYNDIGTGHALADTIMESETIESKP